MGRAAWILVVAALALPAPAAAAEWKPAGNMSQLRLDHTATLLADGRVLVAGYYEDTADLFAPGTATFSPAPDLTHPRNGDHTATRLDDGRVLVTGGWHFSDIEDDTEIYTPGGAWAAADTMTSTRRSHTATLLADGRVLVTGGQTDPGPVTNAVESYDDGADQWTTLAPMSLARHEHTATRLDGGRVLVVGGAPSANPAAKTAELFDPATNTWGPGGTLAAYRTGHTATLLGDGRVLVAGGSSTPGAEVYDPATNSWSAAGTMAVDRFDATATLLASGRVLVAGGFSVTSGQRLKSAEVYDPVANVWTATADMAHARSDHTATRLTSGKVLVTGGATEGSAFSHTAEVYDPDGGSEKPPPHNVFRPAITAPFGLKPGDPVGCSDGTWVLADALTREWLRDGRPIGVTSASYVIREEDRNTDLTCRVTGHNEKGSASADSAPVRVLGTPVIFIPGFAASELQCTGQLGDTDNLWPDAVPKFTEFAFMELAADGVSPGHPVSRCSRTVRPSGRPVESVLGQNVHGNTMRWIASRFRQRGYSFGYDWRKSPGESIDELDRFIDLVRARHGVEKVAIYTHSNGGLLTRWYIDDPGRAAKVARVADVATPWWGTPKPWYPVAYGVEVPEMHAIGPDLVVPNLVMKSFMRNLTGVYFLFPNPSWYAHAGPEARWLRMAGVPQGERGVRFWVGAMFGNPSLLDLAAREHRRFIAGFKTNGVDFRTLVGAGLPTLGAVHVPLPPPSPAGYQFETARFAYTNGDGTVALTSQRQHARGQPQLLADGQRTPIPMYYFCGIGHMPEPEDPRIQRAVERFLGDEGADVDRSSGFPGAAPFLTDAPCPLDGSVIDYIAAAADPRVDVALTVELAGTTRKRATRTLSLRDAERRGLVDAVRVGRRTVISTASDSPVRVTLRGRGYVVRTSRVTDAGTRAARSFGPVVGAATFTLRAGAAVTARRGRRVLRPSRPDRAAPLTTVRVTRGRVFSVLRFRALDRSGVSATWVRVGRGTPRAAGRALRVRTRDLARVTFCSVDTWGNVERTRRVPPRVPFRR